MRLEGQFALAGIAPEDAWQFLTDPEQIAQCLPGCERLIKTSDDTYEMTLKIGIGPIRGAFSGTIRLHDLDPVRNYQMSVSGSGAPGFLNGEGSITLSDSGSGTDLKYSGDVNAGGAIATVGQRMIGGAARLVIDQFFKCAALRLAESR